MSIFNFINERHKETIRVTPNGYIEVFCNISNKWAQVEHYSGELLEDSPKTRKTVSLLIDRCLYLNLYGVALSANSVVWRKEAYDRIIEIMRSEEWTKDRYYEIVSANRDIFDGNTTDKVSKAELSRHLYDNALLRGFGLRSPVKLEISMTFGPQAEFLYEDLFVPTDSIELGVDMVMENTTVQVLLEDFGKRVTADFRNTLGVQEIQCQIKSGVRNFEGYARKCTFDILLDELDNGDSRAISFRVQDSLKRELRGFFTSIYS